MKAANWRRRGRQLVMVELQSSVQCSMVCGGRRQEAPRLFVGGGRRLTSPEWALSWHFKEAGSFDQRDWLA